MSLRFRRTIKLIPGVRLNLSKSGLSISAGAPGATVNFGKRGTYATVGAPGTGVSYRTKIGDSHPQDTKSTGVESRGNLRISIELQDDGTVIIRREDGSLVPDSWITKIRRLHGQEIRQFLESAIDKRNASFLENVHLNTPSPDSSAGIQEEAFSLPAPEPPVAKSPCLFSRLLGYAEEIEKQNLQERELYERNRQDWEIKKADFEAQSKAKAAAAQNALRTNAAVMTDALEGAIHNIGWATEVESSFEISQDFAQVALELTCPSV
ncbi:MAG: DUF4236 domain-containing protein, partial [Bdellovibrionales bacterium]|nr:DUF4236 domain-containing protein [Bdellovibrionales bacterium]